MPSRFNRCAQVHEHGSNHTGLSRILASTRARAISGVMAGSILPTDLYYPQELRVLQILLIVDLDGLERLEQTCTRLFDLISLLPPYEEESDNTQDSDSFF